MEIPMCARHRLSEIAGWWPIAGRRRAARGLSLALILGLTCSVPAAGEEPARRPSTLALAGRTVAQDQGAWVVDYRLRHTGPTGVMVAPEEIAVKVEGWVSNSRVASHAVPRHSLLAIPHAPELTAESKVIAAANQEHECREKLICQVSAVRGPGPADAGRGGSRSTKVPATDNGQRTTDKRTEPLSLEPGGMVQVRLRLEHHHVIFGDYDPLLGVRTVEITLAGASVRDVVALDREQYLAQPRFTWPEPPEERRDTRHSVSGPDSLHLEAHVPGHHYYRYPDRPVRYGTPMRLRFWYLIAAGTEGECRYRVAQYKDTPTSWRMLNDAGFEKCLKVVGRWTQVEHVFTTDAEATTLALDFRIVNDTDIGEMWIDDVRLEPVGCPGHTGP
jgi:hypothetical protein